MKIPNNNFHQGDKLRIGGATSSPASQPSTSSSSSPKTKSTTKKTTMSLRPSPSPTTPTSKSNISPHHHHLSSSLRSRSSSSCKWSLIVAVCQLASVLSQAMTQGPKFGEGIPNVTVAVGRDASLPCVVESLGNHKVAWVHIDRRMILTIHKHIVTKIPRFSVSYDSHKTWLLHVNSVQQEDRGYYMCQVNTEPMISQVGYLQVVVPPNILDEESSESHVAVREHQNITLSCKAEGFPEPRITWRREDGKEFAVDRRKKVNSSDGDRLLLYKISRLEMGAYLCISSNGVPPSVSKRIIVDVEFSPMVWVPNQLVGAPSGTNVTLECHTEAFPRAISYWVYDSMMILTTGKYHTETLESNYKTHMRLTVRSLRDKDYGKYRCLSKNSLGETEGSIRLYEIPMPSLPPKATEVRVSKDNSVGVVRLNPISKQDEKRGRTRSGSTSADNSKSDPTSLSNGLITNNDGQSGSSNEDDSLRSPSIESASASDNSGRPRFSIQKVTLRLLFVLNLVLLVIM